MKDLLLGLGARPEAGLALEVDRLPLDLVDDGVHAGFVGDGGGVAAQGLAVDHERYLDDVGVGRTPMVFDRELDDRVAPVVQQALDALEAALGVLADSIGNLEVLALDDRPHGRPPRCSVQPRHRAGPRARRGPRLRPGRGTHRFG